MKKSKKRLFLVSAFILLIGYYSKDYKYKKNNYKIVDGNFYATYSDGLVYIGDEDFLNNITASEYDVLVCDSRENTKNPDMIIYNSYLIEDKDKRNEILEIICEYEKCYPSNWNRSIESMRLEWYMHNLSYFLNFRKDRTTDVDFDNDDEKKYDKILLRKVLKL